MSWVRIDDHAHRHPKQLQAGPMACWLWVCGLSYCSEHLTDGNIPSAALATFNIPRPTHEADRLVAVGLWEVTETGYRVHDYGDYQPSKAQVRERRERTANRVTEWKKRQGHVAGDTLGNAPGNAVTNAVTNAVGNTVTNAAHPIPIPIPIPIPQEPTVCVPTSRPKPLAYKGRLDVAWPGRPNVPGSLHEDFIIKLGGDPEDARRRLGEWYPTAAAPYENQPIGDDDFKFWRARFREWVGTTEKPAKPGRSSASPIPTSYDEWCDHEPRCSSREWHAVLLMREAEPAEVAQ